MACEYACGSKTGCARGVLLWNRAFVKGACSRPSCSTSYKLGLHAFQGEQKHHRRFGALEEKTGAGGRGEAIAREPVLVTPLFGMLYVDDAGFVLRSPEQLRKMMGVIVVVCAAFSFTLEAKTEIICLRTKRMPPRQRTRCTTKRTSSNISRKTPIKMPTCSSRLVGAYATHGADSGRTPSNCTTGRAPSSSSKFGC